MSSPEAGAPQPVPPHMRRPILCCDEPTCQRKRPLGVFLSDFEPRRVYVATDWRERSPGHYSATQKHEVTEQVKDFIRRNPEWVRAVLRSRM